MTPLLAIPLLALTAGPFDENPIPGFELEPVEQTVADMTEISTSLRELEVGLRQSNDFSLLYRRRGIDHELVRMQGGLYAVFPNSVYRSVEKQGIKPVIPSGTVFHIGAPAGWTPAEPRAGIDRRIEGRIEGRLRLRVTPARAAGDRRLP